MLISLLSCAWLTPADLAARLGGDSGTPGDDTDLPDTDAPDTDCETSTWYANGDGDDYGDDGAAVEACEQPEGHLPVGGDCDDADADIHPDQQETCGNGTDEDCDGVDASCIDGEVEVGSVGFLSPGAGAEDAAGYWVKVTDYDQDGANDWVATAPFSDAGSVDGGALYVMDGDGHFGEPLEGGASSAFVGGAAGDLMGIDVAFAGDFADDGGCDNLVFGAPGYARSGALNAGFVGVLRCGQLGHYDLGSDDVLLNGFFHVDDTTYFGASVVGLDFSEHLDAVRDIAVGGPGFQGDGAVWVIYGEEVDDGTSYSIEPTGLSMRFEAESTADYAGAAVENLGDHTGDGFDDLGVGATGVQEDDRGKLHIVAGGGSATGVGSLADATLTLYGAVAGDHLGYAIHTLGDVDGDGLHDLVVSAPAVNGDLGAVYVVLGSQRDRTFVGYANIDEYATTTVVASSDSGRFGAHMAPVDVDGDGQVELVVGATQEQALSSTGGAVYVFFGLGEGTWSSDDAHDVLYRDSTDSALGSSIAALTNGEHATLLVGDNIADGEEERSGGVWAVPLY